MGIEFNGQARLFRCRGRDAHRHCASRRAGALSEPKAREIIGPWYSLFNVATRGDVEAIQERVLTAD